MTAWEALIQAPKRLGAAAERPRLRGLASPARRLATVPFAALVVVLLAAGMVGMLLLTTQLQTQAFAVRTAQRQAAELAYRVSDLEAQVTQAKAPIALARRATELGMVPNPNGVFIDLASGTVVGKAAAVRGDEIPSLRVLPPAPVVTPAPDAVDAAPPATAPAVAP